MFEFLWLIPVLPYAGFLVLALAGNRLPRAFVAGVGVGSVGLSALLSIILAAFFIKSPPSGHIYIQTLWTWIDVAGFSPQIAFHLDALSLVMTLVITFVGFLIHLYSTEFMEEEEGYSRFFAYMNLFVGSMLVLVLADNLLLLYLGWEGVGLCSYLLIGFWYSDPANGRAARKAFVVTRVGDTAMAIGLFLLFAHFGTLNIQELLHRAPNVWAVGSTPAVVAAALLLIGALGKSAQLPLQTWLPDAMAGPSPVSALIHAATMVTAGVYLIARTNVLFTLAPVVQSAVAAIGALTLLVAGCTAITQRDIKRVLAYSTISQIGYMFLALGVGAWSAAMFHFMTHAFFKALLFLAAGVVILGQHHEHDMFKMGGLRSQTPLTFWTFLIGAASLAALPLVTAGFYSKDLILWEAWISQSGNAILWFAGVVGAFITSAYTFRMVFVTFFGANQRPFDRTFRLPMTIPLVILAALSLATGFLELPHTLGGLSLFSDFMHTILPDVVHGHGSIVIELTLQVIASAASLGGIYLAYRFYFQFPERADRLVENRLNMAVHRFWSTGWGFDRLYDALFVQPFIQIARLNKKDVIDRIFVGVAGLCLGCHRALSRTQTGLVRQYAMGIAVGSIILIAIVILL